VKRNLQNLPSLCDDLPPLPDAEDEYSQRWFQATPDKDATQATVAAATPTEPQVAESDDATPVNSQLRSDDEFTSHNAISPSLPLQSPIIRTAITNSQLFKDLKNENLSKSEALIVRKLNLLDTQI
jgi:hypothetical protein